MSKEIIGTDRKGNEWSISLNSNNEWDICKNGTKETEMSTRANALVVVQLVIGAGKVSA
jgi:hypothetical protein